MGLGLSLTALYSDHQKILPVLILSVGYFGLVQGIHGGIQKIFTGLEGGFRLAIIESLFTLVFISTIGAKAIEQVSALVERSEFGIPKTPSTLLVPGILNEGQTTPFHFDIKSLFN